MESVSLMRRGWLRDLSNCRVTNCVLRNVGVRPMKITGFCRPFIYAGDVSKNRRVSSVRPRSTWRSKYCRALIASRRATLAGNLITDIRGRRFSLSLSASPQLSDETRSISGHAMFVGNNTSRDARRRRWLTFLIDECRIRARTRQNKKNLLILNIPNQFSFNFIAVEKK